MTKQPWEEKVVEDKDQSANRKTKGSVVSTPLLTGLLSVFFVIIVAILFVVFYTSNRSGDKVSETSNFYGASTSSSVSTSSQAPAAAIPRIPSQSPPAPLSANTFSVSLRPRGR